jgi:hypothetical protein
MSKLRFINGLDISKSDIVSLLWTVEGVAGRLVKPTTTRAKEYLERTALGSPDIVVGGLAFASEADYIELCPLFDAEGLSRDDE